MTKNLLFPIFLCVTFGASFGIPAFIQSKNVRESQNASRLAEERNAAILGDRPIPVANPWANVSDLDLLDGYTSDFDRRWKQQAGNYSVLHIDQQFPAHLQAASRLCFAASDTEGRTAHVQEMIDSYPALLQELRYSGRGTDSNGTPLHPWGYPMPTERQQRSFELSVLGATTSLDQYTSGRFCQVVNARYPVANNF